MGVREILKEWTAFRVECVRRRTYYDLHGKEKRLHLLKGLAAILLDIDKAIKNYPHHRGRDRSGAQPDDRFWHR